MMTSKNVLLVNGISSGATGILLIAFAEFFATLFGITNSMIFTGTGIFLVVFAAFVVSVATRKKIETRNVQLVTALDLIWTIGSFLLVILVHKEISILGNALIVAVALWVALMAILQTKSLKQLTL